MPESVDTSQPLYRQLAGKLQRAIEHGSLKGGDRLPSVRDLASREGVSLATAVSTFRFLENIGQVEARPKSGYFVKGRAPRLPEPEMQLTQARARHVTINDSVMSILAVMREPGLVPLGAACPGPELYPTAKLRRLLSAQHRSNLNAIGTYGMSMGNPALRKQIMRRYADVDVLLDPEDIIITIGAMEALNICIQAVAHHGDTIAIESPTYFGILQIIENLGLKALEIPTSPRDGISLEAIELATRKPGAVKAVIVMPTVQNPLGSIMPDDNKKQLVALMRDRGIPIIEDDIYGELAFAKQRPKPLKAWDTDNNVLLCGSFTKILAPGFRVGYIAAGKWRDRVEHLKFTNTVSTPEILQMAIAAFMENGGYDLHLRHLREAFQAQLRKTTETVEHHFPPGTRLTRPDGGFLLWVELPGNIDSLAFFRRAVAAGIYVGPGSIFSSSERFNHYLRINCGYPWSATIETALATLGRICHDMLEAG
jgi:DNA-binding transcriptional MocR family regulator